jgi:hypothetical protein
VTEPATTYSEVGDMIQGPMPFPASMDLQKFVQAATDEIDMKIGFIYKTPVRAPEGEELPRPVSLLLKKIASYISTARAIYAAAGAVHSDELNAYARSLLAEAHAALDNIATGRMELEGAERLPDRESSSRGPRISNVDSYSQVESFYGNFTGGTSDMFSPSPFAALSGVDPHSG